MQQDDSLVLALRAVPPGAPLDATIVALVACESIEAFDYNVHGQDTECDGMCVCTFGNLVRVNAKAKSLADVSEKLRHSLGQCVQEVAIPMDKAHKIMDGLKRASVTLPACSKGRHVAELSDFAACIGPGAPLHVSFLDGIRVGTLEHAEIEHMLHSEPGSWRHRLRDYAKERNIPLGAFFTGIVILRARTCRLPSEARLRPCLSPLSTPGSTSTSTRIATDINDELCNDRDLAVAHPSVWTALSIASSVPANTLFQLWRRFFIPPREHLSTARMPFLIQVARFVARRQEGNFSTRVTVSAPPPAPSLPVLPPVAPAQSKNGSDHSKKNKRQHSRPLKAPPTPPSLPILSHSMPAVSGHHRRHTSLDMLAKLALQQSARNPTQDADKHTAGLQVLATACRDTPKKAKLSLVTPVKKTLATSAAPPVSQESEVETETQVSSVRRKPSVRRSTNSSKKHTKKRRVQVVVQHEDTASESSEWSDEDVVLFRRDQPSRSKRQAAFVASSRITSASRGVVVGRKRIR